MWFAADGGRLDQGFASLLNVIRSNYSMPPDRGAAVVARVLSNVSMRAIWQEERDQMRRRLRDVRAALVEGFRVRLQSNAFDFIGEHQGMFCMPGLSPAQVERLRDKPAIYMAGDSRTHIAGLHLGQVDAFVDAVPAVR